MNILELKVRTRLSIGFGIVLLLLVSVAVFGIDGMNRSNKAMRHVVDVNIFKMALLEDMSGSVHVVSRVMRTIALLRDDEEANRQRKKIDEAREKYDNAFSKLEKMPLDDAGKAFIAKIGNEATLSRSINNQFLGLAKSNRDDAVRLMMKDAIPATAAWQDTLHEFIELQKTKSKNDEEEAESAYHRSLIFMLVFTGLAILLGIFISWLITRSILAQLGGEPAEAMEVAGRIAKGDLAFDIHTSARDESSLLFALKMMRESLANIVGEVRTGTDTIATASRQIATGNMDLSSRTEEQASSLEETASSMEELTSTVKQNADNARQANQLATTASDIANKGGAIVSQVVNTMSSINASSKKIVDIISVIDGIAFQTNILALNAAVEAARAGEQGRGFAVVASEVRNLAQRSAAAAKEIKELIGNSVERVDAGAKLVNQAGSTMNDIVESIRHVTDIMSEIAAASQEQTSGIEQINQAITQMDDVTQQNAALVEEAAAAAKSLEDQANNLNQVVSVFKLDSKYATRTSSSKASSRAPTNKAMNASTMAVNSNFRNLSASAVQLKRENPLNADNNADWEEF